MELVINNLYILYFIFYILIFLTQLIFLKLVFDNLKFLNGNIFIINYYYVYILK
jgi:hypothetical protein